MLLLLVLSLFVVSLVLVISWVSVIVMVVLWCGVFSVVLFKFIVCCVGMWLVV